MGHVGVGWGGSCRGGVGGSCRGGVGHVGVGWGGSCRGGVGVGHVGVEWGGSCRGGVGWVCHVGVGWGGLCRGGVGHYKGKHDYKMHIYHDYKKLQILHNVTTKQGSRNIKGADLCLAYDIGVWRQWGPLSVDMRPYGCFISRLPLISDNLDLYP